MRELDIEAAGLFGQLGDSTFVNLATNGQLNLTIECFDNRRVTLRVGDSDVEITLTSERVQGLLDRAGVPICPHLTLVFVGTRLTRAFVDFS